jgi:beta-lactamase regulating signal transducer with metallopeptidase domain
MRYAAQPVSEDPMTALTTSPTIQALAWTLVHFLWQGAALGLAVFLWLRVWRPTAQARYAGGIVALAALLAAPVATFAWLARSLPDLRVEPVALPAGPPAGAVGVGRVPAAPLTASPGLDTPGTRSEAGEVAAVAVVTAWALGVLLLSVRLTGGWILARRLVAGAAMPAAADVHAVAAVVARRLGLTRAVRVVESPAVSVPMLVGWARPVVLFPASALSGLSAEQVEALIAHELAHVRRHDYLVNILQSLVDTLLFYHPAVWFVSREVREAREQCCDDLAIGVCDPVVYASALADLAAMSGTPRLALAATDGSLVRRVRRILGQPRADCGPGVTWLGVLSVALVTGAVMPAALGSAATGQPDMDGVQRAGSEGRSIGSVTGIDEGAGRGVGATVTGGVASGIEGAVAEGVGPVSDGTSGGESPAVGMAPNGDAAPRRPQEERRRQEEEESRRMRQAELEFLEFQGRLRREEDARRQLEQRVTSGADLRELEARIAAVELRVAARAQPLAGGPAGDVAAGSSARLEAMLVRARADLDVARAEHERSQQAFAIGRLSSSGLREAQERLAAAERALAAAAAEVQATAEEAAARDTLDARRGRLQSESRIRQAELELMAAQESLQAIEERVDIGAERRETLAEARTRMAAAAERLTAARAEFDLTQEEIALRQMRTAALRHLVSETAAQHARVLQAADERSSVVMDAAAQAQPGDILSIEIAGEPDLPRAYRVDSEGAIRLPLMGAIQVAGLTTQQVRDAMTEVLKQRQLGEGRSIAVTLRRPK